DRRDPAPVRGLAVLAAVPLRVPAQRPPGLLGGQEVGPARQVRGHDPRPAARPPPRRGHVGGPGRPAVPLTRWEGQGYSVGRMDDPRARRLFGDSLVAPGDLATSPYRVDRDRIVSSPFFARLGGVTQVISPGGAGLLVHNRMTHSLKVAQVARAIAERLVVREADLLEKLGGCDPDVVEAAAL